MALIDRTDNTDYDLCWARADNDPKGFTINKSDGTPLDITGYSYIMSVNSTKNPTSAPLFSINGVLDDPTNGKVSFSPLTSDTDITPGTYFYDIQQTDTTSKIKTLVKGKLIIIQDITK